MFTPNEIQQIKQRGSSLETVEQQVENFKKGFPYMKVLKPATVENGIIRLNDNQIDNYVKLYNESIAGGLSIMKFVPASGAASRMFQKLFAFRDAVKNDEEASEKISTPEHEAVKLFFGNLTSFAFYEELIDLLSTTKSTEDLVHYCKILDLLLTDQGLNYGFLPKGLLKFHTAGKDAVTPVEEHLKEGVEYGQNSEKEVNIHFTVSPEHRELFEEKSAKVSQKIESLLGVKFNISFSEQKPSTDTIAVDLDNNPFRLGNNQLFFRPGGHGALLENLNDIESDIVFIKNIDNVVPERLLEHTVLYKKALAGVLIAFRERIFNYLEILHRPIDAIAGQQLVEIAEFLQKELCLIPKADLYYMEKEELIALLIEKLNRPIRVCGMVKNEGEPGGGPFWAENADKSVSLQIVEGSQIDKSDAEQTAIVNSSTHFNPVDLVCGTKDYKGNKFNLLNYRDPETGFISSKTREGRDLKAQELPGLWNGAMADWNTLFVEVPVITFNPVKTVNDLLRKEHQEDPNKGSYC